MTVDQFMTWAEQRGVKFSRRDGRLVITGIRRLSKRKQAELRVALASQAPSLDAHPGDEAPGATPSEGSAPRRVPPREPVRPAPEETKLECFVRPDGRRVTEADVIEALSMLGDEQVEAYREGRLPKVEAYRIARDRLRPLARMTAGLLYWFPYRREL